jgi:protein arginine kinase
VRDALLSGNSAIAADFDFVQMDDLSNEQAVSLVERHIVSPEFIANSQRGAAYLISKDERISIMVNEEDHVRIQSAARGSCAQRSGRDGRPDRYAFKRKR